MELSDATKTPGPTGTLNESLGISQLYSGQRTRFKSFHLSYSPGSLPNTTCIRPDHLPHDAVSLRPSLCAKLWTWTAAWPPLTCKHHLHLNWKLSLVTHYHTRGSGCFIKGICMQGSRWGLAVAGAVTHDKQRKSLFFCGYWWVGLKGRNRQHWLYKSTLATCQVKDPLFFICYCTFHNHERCVSRCHLQANKQQETNANYT